MAGSENGNFFIVPNIVADDESLPGTEKLVLYSLLRHFNQERQKAWPSQETIARKAGLKRRCVVDALKRLEEKGIIKVERNFGNVSLYEINLSALHAPVQEMHMCITDTPPVHLMHTPCAGDAHLPVHEMHTNNTSRTRLKNNTNEQEGRLLSPDPWIRDRLSEICQVVNAPKPANLDLLIGQWREAYGERTVEQTILKALRWMQDNDRRYKDMGRFLGNWLARDAARNVPVKTARRVNYGDTLPSWDEIRREENRR